MRRFLLPLVLVSACDATGASGKSAEVIVDSPCLAGGLVDSEFRDGALKVLERLAVQAPGRTSHGAVRTHHTAGHVDAQGHAWHQVSAYQVNLGLIGALRVAPQLLPLAAAKLPPTGCAGRPDTWPGKVRAGVLCLTIGCVRKTMRNPPARRAWRSRCAGLLMPMTAQPRPPY